MFVSVSSFESRTSHSIHYGGDVTATLHDGMTNISASYDWLQPDILRMLQDKTDVTQLTARFIVMRAIDDM